MLFSYKCEECRNQTICKRYEDLKDKLTSIERSVDNKSGWGTDVMIDLGKEDDGLIFDLQCELFSKDPIEYVFSFKTGKGSNDDQS